MSSLRTPRWLEVALREDNSLALSQWGCTSPFRHQYLANPPTSFSHGANSTSSHTRAGADRWGSLCGHSHDRGAPNVTGCLASCPKRSLETLCDSIPKRQRDGAVRALCVHRPLGSLDLPHKGRHCYAPFIAENWEQGDVPGCTAGARPKGDLRGSLQAAAWRCSGPGLRRQAPCSGSCRKQMAGRGRKWRGVHAAWQSHQSWP